MSVVYSLRFCVRWVRGNSKGRMNRGDNSSMYRCKDGMNRNHGVWVVMECRGVAVEQDKPRVDRANVRVLL